MLQKHFPDTTGSIKLLCVSPSKRTCVWVSEGVQAGARTWYRRTVSENHKVDSWLKCIHASDLIINLIRVCSRSVPTGTGACGTENLTCRYLWGIAQSALLCKNPSVARFLEGHGPQGSSFLSPTIPRYRLRLLTYDDTWPNSSVHTKPTMWTITKEDKANMAGNKAILQVLHLSQVVASWIHSAITPETENIRCLLDTDKHNEHIGTVCRKDNTRSDRPRLPNGPGVGWWRLHIMTAQVIKWNAALEHAASSDYPYTRHSRTHLRPMGQGTPTFLLMDYIHPYQYV